MQRLANGISQQMAERYFCWLHEQLIFTAARSEAERNARLEWCLSRLVAVVVASVICLLGMEFDRRPGR
jgi:hypothetical protein